MKKLLLILAIAVFSVALFGQTQSLNVITGLTETDSITAADVTLLDTDCNNGLQSNNDADAVIFRLPSARAGLSVSFYDDAGGVITIIPAAADYISLDGTDLDILDTVDSSGTKGEAITLIALSATHWISYGPGNGTWSDAGAE